MNERRRKHLKKWIAIRAGGRCEYCRVLEYLSHYEFHLEHIIGQQHGGTSLPENLAYVCSWPAAGQSGRQSGSSSRTRANSAVNTFQSCSKDTALTMQIQNPSLNLHGSLAVVVGFSVEDKPLADVPSFLGDAASAAAVRHCM